MRRFSSVITALGLALLAVSAFVAMRGGFLLSMGGLQISATGAPRIGFEAAVLLVLGEVLGGRESRWRLLAVLACLFVTAAWDSSTRRVGDGFEYLAMARNLGRLEAPALTAAEFPALAAETAALGDATWVQMPIPSLRGRDDRYDFPHFWLYSLIASPCVAIAIAVGMHPAAGFTVLNIVLLVGTCWLLLRGGAFMVAVLYAALMLWWVDKAHAEVFITTLMVSGLMLRRMAPAASLLLLGLVAAQMPLMLGLLAACALAAVVASRTPRTIAAVAGAFALAALHPLYYLWRLGVTSPLGGTISPHIPGVRAFMTPIIDLNLGIVWFAPLLAISIVIGAVMMLWSRAWADLLPVAVGATVVLVAAAQTPNVNHGGTPGMSRYGVWLVAVLLPLAVRGVAPLMARRAVAVRIAAALTVVFAAIVLHPRLGDFGARPAPSQLATFVWTRWPALDNPLPEVFVERVGHVDGLATLPIATPRCEKALVVGTGDSVAWPEPCAHRAAPPSCVAAGALCYANGSSFAIAPLP